MSTTVGYNFQTVVVELAPYAVGTNAQSIQAYPGKIWVIAKQIYQAGSAPNATWTASYTAAFPINPADLTVNQYTGEITAEIPSWINAAKRFYVVNDDGITFLPVPTGTDVATLIDGTSPAFPTAIPNAPIVYPPLVASAAH